MPPSEPHLVVRAWLAAVNAADADAALALTAPDVVLVGPQGAAQGHAVLRAWIGHAGARFATHALYARGDAVVAAQRGTWRDPAGATLGDADVATRFRVAEALVAELERHDALDDALRAAGLTTADAAPS
ncbi:nuclear transport factor 2 family protein [Roseisolibacter sp. H3M3-2]|uniref:nuclear transport factor 2 family protein n=1 Tax=Roseisolibacter sp. H3M3-2 TaxID=3031323 RepID=UPI0023DB175D|nr:nuclear transport factor 2 family protein [Roseisolibacter sp. H3M3-2]MDF1505824.1 nuclear transport factor 2 family protein [Roseisolibacter sp. H3M3-2]